MFVLINFHCFSAQTKLDTTNFSAQQLPVRFIMSMCCAPAVYFECHRQHTTIIPCTIECATQAVVPTM